jgi:hypothetical protein
MERKRFSPPFHLPVPVTPEQTFQRSRTIQQIVLHGLSCWALWLASDMYMARVDFFRVLSNHFVIIINQSARNLIVEDIALDCSCLPNDSTAFPGHENRCDESFVRNLCIDCKFEVGCPDFCLNVLYEKQSRLTKRLCGHTSLLPPL